MNMKVLMLPGATSPYSNDIRHVSFYKDCIEALKETCVNIVTYAGQIGKKGTREGELLFENSLREASTYFEQADSEDIRLLCFCYGCLVGAQLVPRYAHLIRRAVFWAPLAFSALWEHSVLSSALWNNQEEYKGVKVAPRISKRLIPFGISIRKLGENCLVSMGENDKYMVPETIEYYRSLAHPARPCFKLLPGLSHTITASDKGWELFVSEVLAWLTV